VSRIYFWDKCESGVNFLDILKSNAVVTAIRLNGNANIEFRMSRREKKFFTEIGKVTIRVLENLSTISQTVLRFAQI